MKRHLGLLVAAVTMLAVILFVAPVLIELDHLVGQAKPSSNAVAAEHKTWMLLAGMAALMLVAGYALAHFEAKRLARPLDDLTVIALRRGPAL